MLSFHQVSSGENSNEVIASSIPGIVNLNTIFFEIIGVDRHIWQLGREREALSGIYREEKERESELVSYVYHWIMSVSFEESSDVKSLWHVSERALFCS